MNSNNSRTSSQTAAQTPPSETGQEFPSVGQPDAELREPAKAYLREWSENYQRHGDLARFDWCGSQMEYHLANFASRAVAALRSSALLEEIGKCKTIGEVVEVHRKWPCSSGNDEIVELRKLLEYYQRKLREARPAIKEYKERRGKQHLEGCTYPENPCVCTSLRSSGMGTPHPHHPFCNYWRGPIGGSGCICVVTYRKHLQELEALEKLTSGMAKEPTGEKL